MIYTHKNGISLRKVEQIDLPALKELKDSSWYGHIKPAFLNLSDQEEWFKSMTRSHSDLFFMMESKMGEYLLNIGLVKYTGIDWINRTANVGIDLYPNMRGKGFGRKIIEVEIDFGFEVLNLHREYADVLDGNWVLKLNLDSGFKMEGVRNGAVRRNGRWVDLIEIGITYEEWENLDRVKSYGGVCNTGIVFTPKKEGKNENKNG